MKKLKLLGGALILAAAAPAAAQYRSTYSYPNISYELDQFGTRLEQGVASRRLTRDEAYSLRQELRSLRQLERSYRVGGFNRYELTELQRRLDNLRQRLDLALGDEESRGRDYDDDRDWNDRDGDWDDGRSRDDSDWNRRRDWDEEDCPPGLERRDNGCVPPGQQNRWGDDDYDDRDDDDRPDYDSRSQYRVPGTLYAVPERYRYQYRDTDRYYYRYRDGYIYRMDRRTNRRLDTIWVGR